MIAAIELPLPLQEQLRDEALRACPRECCGLIEGFAEGALSRAIALHPMPNLAQQPDRFEVDPAAHIALLRNLRGTGREIIGCYHSHPNGRAEPSERDRESAVEPDYLWLICAVETNRQTTSVAAFLRAGSALLAIPIVHERGTASACGRT